MAGQSEEMLQQSQSMRLYVVLDGAAADRLDDFRPAAKAVLRLLPQALRARGLQVDILQDGVSKEKEGRDALAVWVSDPAVYRTLMQQFLQAEGLPQQSSTRGEVVHTEAERLGMLLHSVRSATLLDVWHHLSAEEAAALDGRQMSTTAVAALEDWGIVKAVLAPRSEGVLEVKDAWRPWVPCGSLPERELLGYFGPHAFHYFFFLHAYVQWLPFPALLGVICWLCHRRSSDSTGEYCSFSTEVFTVLMGICSTLWVKDWKRMFGSVRLRTHCGRRDDADQLLVNTRWIRRDSKAVEVQADPIVTDTSSRHVWTLAGVCSMIGVTCVVIHLLSAFSDLVESYSDSLIMNVIPIIAYLVIVGLCQKVYEKLAQHLTAKEYHCLRDEQLKSLIMKRALFQLINYHGWFLYVAFWKRDIELLHSQLLTFLTVKQVVGNFQEAILPHLLEKWAWRRSTQETSNTGMQPSNGGATSTSTLSLDEGFVAALSGGTAAQKEAWRLLDFEMSKPEPDVFDEYIEMAVLFSMMCAYAPVLPLGPALLLLHAVFEASSDMYKHCNVQRRWLPQRDDAVEAETWIGIFDAVSILGVMCSVALIHVAHPGAWSPAALIAAEHLLLFFKGYLTWNIPDVPEWIRASPLLDARRLPLGNGLSAPASSSRLQVVATVPFQDGADKSSSIGADRGGIRVRQVRVTGLPHICSSPLRRKIVRVCSGDDVAIVPMQGAGQEYSTLGQPLSFCVPSGSSLTLEVLVGRLRSFGRSYQLLGSVTLPPERLQPCVQMAGGAAARCLELPMDILGTIDVAILTVELRDTSQRQ